MVSPSLVPMLVPINKLIIVSLRITLSAKFHLPNLHIFYMVPGNTRAASNNSHPS